MNKMREGMKPYMNRKPQVKDPDMIFGMHPVLEALRKGSDFDKVILQQGLRSAQLAELKVLLDEYEIPVQTVPQEKLNRLTPSNHQGVIGFITPVTFQPLEEILQRVYESGKDPFLLVLDRITDVRNFGAICRTAECAGIDAVIIPSRGSARISGDAVKTSAGALLNLPVCRASNLKETLEYLKNSGISLVAVTEKTDSDVHKTELVGPICLILGSEEDGISPEYLKRSDKRVKIPMFGKTGSLNVSVAAAIVIYETLRQRLLN
jgi:23S rRNA (guanosine2251-2'-O)-methyltransferase